MTELMRLRWFPTFPRLKMVDRRGFAPRFAAPAARQHALRDSMKRYRAGRSRLQGE